MAKADRFVLLDDVELPNGGSWAHRTRIKTPDGLFYLTLSVHASHGTSYCDARVATKDRGLKKLWKTLRHNYTRAPHFDCYKRPVRDWLLSCSGMSLAYANLGFIVFVRDTLGIDTKIYLKSLLDVKTHKTEMILDLCDALECDTYLSGQGARVYNDPDLFAERNVELCYQDFVCKPYEQPWGPFAANLSIVDALFNCGGSTCDLLEI